MGKVESNNSGFRYDWCENVCIRRAKYPSFGLMREFNDLVMKVRLLTHSNSRHTHTHVMWRTHKGYTFAHNRNSHQTGDLKTQTYSIFVHLFLRTSLINQMRYHWEFRFACFQCIGFGFFKTRYWTNLNLNCRVTYIYSFTESTQNLQSIYFFCSPKGESPLCQNQIQFDIHAKKNQFKWKTFIF